MSREDEAAELNEIGVFRSEHLSTEIQQACTVHTEVFA
jgi:hypothetical protein